MGLTSWVWCLVFLDYGSCFGPCDGRRLKHSGNAHSVGSLDTYVSSFYTRAHTLLSNIMSFLECLWAPVIGAFQEVAISDVHREWGLYFVKHIYFLHLLVTFGGLFFDLWCFFLLYNKILLLYPKRKTLSHVHFFADHCII